MDYNKLAGGIMMKLNKNGWGLTEMLVLTGIILFFFLVAIFLIYRLYSNLDRTINNNEFVNYKTYSETEVALENAANSYIDNKYEGMTDTATIVISLKKLVNMGYLVENIHEDCNGYTLSSIINGESISNAYISCDEYETTGYESWRINE